MESSGVVPVGDPGGDVAACLAAGGPGVLVDEFVLEGGEERLGGGVVECASHASGGLGDAEALAGGREISRCVLAGLNRSSQHRVVVASVDVRRGLLLGSSIRGSCVAAS